MIAGRRLVAGLLFALVAGACNATPTAVAPAPSLTPDAAVAGATVGAMAGVAAGVAAVAAVPVSITTSIAPLSPMQLCGSIGGCLHRVTVLRTDAAAFLTRRGLEAYVGVASPAYTDVPTPLSDFAALTPGLYVLVATQQQVSDIVGGPDGPILATGTSCSMTFAVNELATTRLHVAFDRGGCTIVAEE